MQGYLTIKEAAERLGVSDRTVRRRIKDGSLPAKLKMGQYGQQYFIPVNAIDTAQTITDVVEVKRVHDAQALSLAIVQALEEQNKAFTDELEAMKKEVAASRQEITALREELKQRDEKLLELVKAEKQPWWKRLLK